MNKSLAFLPLQENSAHNFLSSKKQLKFVKFVHEHHIFRRVDHIDTVEDKSKIHDVLAVTRHIENFVYWVTADN